MFGKYPGRIIIIGRSSDDLHDIIAYGLTGRSPSSQARELEQKDSDFFVKPTSDAINDGDPELLIYPCILFGEGGVAVSNGKQTTTVRECLSEIDPINVLKKAHGQSMYEHDEPIYTPRISGCITKRGAALAIIKKASDGSTIRAYYNIPLATGKGKMISSYNGENTDPVPSFEGEPRNIIIDKQNPEELAKQIYNELGEFKIAVVALFQNIKTREIKTFIKQR